MTIPKPKQIVVILVVSISVLASFGCGTRTLAVRLEQAAPVVRGGKLTAAVGIETLGGVFTRLIETGQPVPAVSSEVFSTAVDDQEAIKITVYRGLRELVRQNTHVGTFEIYGIGRAKGGTPQIEVTLKVLANGDITVEATDLQSQTPSKIRVLSRTAV